MTENNESHIKSPSLNKWISPKHGCKGCFVSIKIKTHVTNKIH